MPVLQPCENVLVDLTIALCSVLGNLEDWFWRIFNGGFQNFVGWQQYGVLDCLPHNYVSKKL